MILQTKLNTFNIATMNKKTVEQIIKQAGCEQVTHLFSRIFRKG